MVSVAKEGLSLTILTGKFYVKSLKSLCYYESNSQFVLVPHFHSLPE